MFVAVEAASTVTYLYFYASTDQSENKSWTGEAKPVGGGNQDSSMRGESEWRIDGDGEDEDTQHRVVCNNHDVHEKQQHNHLCPIHSADVTIFISTFTFNIYARFIHILTLVRKFSIVMIVVFFAPSQSFINRKEMERKKQCRRGESDTAKGGEGHIKARFARRMLQ